MEGKCGTITTEVCPKRRMYEKEHISKGGVGCGHGLIVCGLWGTTGRRFQGEFSDTGV